MFFAYPTKLDDKVTIDTTVFDKDFAWIKNDPEAEEKMPSKVVDAFAGAALAKQAWERKIGYNKYLETLLSDHVPIYFDYTDEAKSDYRVLFANTGSLIGKRGITDNKRHFGDNITLGDLEELSQKLVGPLLKKMKTLIEDNRVVLEKAGTMKKNTQDGIEWCDEEAGFQNVLDKAEELLSGNPNPTDFYAVLKALSTKKWFRNRDDARVAAGGAAVSDTPATSNIHEAAGDSTKPQIMAKTTNHVEEEEPEIVKSFELVSKRKLDFKRWNFPTTDTWHVCSDHTIINLATGDEADILQSFQKIYLNVITNEVHVRFNGKKGKSEYYFPVKDASSKKLLGEFLIHIRDTCTALDKLNEAAEKPPQHYTITSGINKVLTKLKIKHTLPDGWVLGVDATTKKPHYWRVDDKGNQVDHTFDRPTVRRRMAHREFSSRRDSPVMVRLLEEIIAAQDK